MPVVFFFPSIESGKEVGVGNSGIGEECEGEMRETSLGGIEGDVSFERTVAREVCGFLNSTETTEILGAISLLVTQDFTESAHDVSECRVRHWWF